MSSDANLNAVIGERIREQRKKAKMTRETLAEKIDVSSRFLASLEWGQVGVSVATLKKISLVLGVSCDYLLDVSRDCDEFDKIKSMLSQLPPENILDVTEIVKVFCNSVNRKK